MRIFYEERLTPNMCKILKANDWEIHRFADHPSESIREHGKYNDNSDLYYGSYEGYAASKDFNFPKEAMLEIENIFEIDVIQDKDQSGCSLHTFRWANPDYDASYVIDENTIYPNYKNSEFIFASGWDCAVYMFDCPRNERLTAEAYFTLKNKMEKLNEK